MTLPSSSAKTGSAARILPELGRPLATAGAMVRQPLNRLVSGGLNSTVAEGEAPSRCTHKLFAFKKRSSVTLASGFSYALLLVLFHADGPCPEFSMSVLPLKNGRAFRCLSTAGGIAVVGCWDPAAMYCATVHWELLVP